MTALSNPCSYSLGWTVSNVNPTVSTFALNAANNRFFKSFVAPKTGTISKIGLKVSAVAGTLGENDLVINGYADASGVPTGDSLGSSNTLDVVPTGEAWIYWNNLSIAVTSGNQFWVLANNVNADPTTNYPTLQYHNSMPSGTGGSTTWGNIKADCADGSITPANIVAGVGSMYIEYSDGTCDGYPTAKTNASDIRAHSSREVGNYFQMPPNAKSKLVGVSLAIARSSPAPSGNACIKVYDGLSNLLGTSKVIPVGNISTSIIVLYQSFETPIVLPANALIRVVLANTAADDSSHYFKLQSFSWASETNPQLLKPFRGTMQKTVSLDGGATWTNTPTRIFPMGLRLDYDFPLLKTRGR